MRRAEVLLCAVALLVGAPGAADPQNVPGSNWGPVPAPLRITSTAPIPLLSSPAILMPAFCSADGGVMLRVASPEGEQQFVSIAADGKVGTTYPVEKINDVVNATLRGAFVSGSSIYVLVSGFTEKRTATATVRQADGSMQELKTEVPRELRYFIGRFDKDGSYRGAALLDLSFVPRQFGVFENGDLLVSGRTHTIPSEPRIALVKPNGQLIRFVQPEKDVGSSPSTSTRDDHSDQKPALEWLRSPQAAVDLSTIVADDRDLILARRGPDARIYRVTAGGEVLPIELKVPRNYSLFSLNSGPQWVAQFAYREPDKPGITLVALSFDRSGGVPTGAFAYPAPLGFGLACSDGLEFTFLRREENGTLSIVKAQSSRRASTIEPSISAPVNPHLQ